MRCVTRESGHLWQVSFNPTEDEIKAGASVRFGGRADTFMFSHIAVTPTAGWGDVTAAGIPIASTVGTFGGYNHASSYLMGEHDAAKVGGMGVLQSQ